jgi:uncharacterized protein
MRLSAPIISYFKSSFAEELPGAQIYLYGSRANNNARGGDIDLMVLTPTPVNRSILRNIRIGFYKKFGWQKIDLVNFTFDDQSVFKQLIIADAQEL